MSPPYLPPKPPPAPATVWDFERRVRAACQEAEELGRQLAQLTDQLHQTLARLRSDRKAPAEPPG